ncbi:MAG: citrate/2-methylcitrate synthase [Phycisphaerales bacterium]
MTTDTPAAPVAKGLEGVIAGETAICKVEQHALIYRGYEIADLAEHATFEEVAFLLLIGHKPAKDELQRFKSELAGERHIPHQVTDYLRSMKGALADGTAVPMDVLRSAVSLLGNLDPESQSISAESNLRKAKRLTAKIPTIIGQMQNVIDGRELVDVQTGGDPSLNHAANLLYLMTGVKPSPEHVKVMDVSLILYAEHDYNASTFTSRVIASTLSDLHGAVTGGIAALKGPLHGGANEAAMEMMHEVMDYEAQHGNVRGYMDKAFAEKKKLMGFGHRVYKNGDHRAPILHALGRKVAEKDGPNMVRLFDLGEQVQRIMLEDKQIHPNVDFPCGMTYFAMGIPVPQYTPIFVASRVTGWCAHIMEQHANNRIIRPRVSYTGPELRKWNG